MSKSITRWVAAVLFVSGALASPAAASDQAKLLDRYLGAEEVAAADVAEPPDPVSPDWGGANIIYSIGACDAGSTDATHTYQALNCARLEPLASQFATVVGFPVHLPSGAVITSIKVNYFDTYSGAPTVIFRRIDTAGNQFALANFTFPVFNAGNTTLTVPTNHTVNNLGFSYILLAALFRDASGFTGIYGFEISYHLQVSPAPATATFPNDVPTSHPFFRFIEAMAASGLTGGCGAGLFCPNDPVTRGQMAVFLSTALGLHFPN